MDSVELILKYFKNLTPEQIEKFERLRPLFEEWNAQINVISRKDMDTFYERHVLHSLAIAKVISFEANTSILDIGTGGGFPGIPLAILFPEVEFLLVDSIGKKIKVVNAIAQELKLSNIRAIHDRAENINEQFDFVISRAVTAMPKFIKWTKSKFKNANKNSFKNGILYLKGGDLTDEMSTVKKAVQYFDIANYFEEEFFETKKVVYVRN